MTHKLSCAADNKHYLYQDHRIHLSNQHTPEFLTDLTHFQTQGQATLEDIVKLHELQVPVPAHELDRIQLLRQSQLLDTPPEEPYDRYVSMAARIFKVTCSKIVTLLYG